MFRSLRISHAEFRFPGSEKLGPSRNGRMERNFPVIPIFRNFRPTSRCTPKFRKMSVPFAPQPGIFGIFGRMESAHEDPRALRALGALSFMSCHLTPGISAEAR